MGTEREVRVRVRSQFAALYPELAALQHGARSILQRYADAMVVLHFAPDLLLDIDTPEDYDRARARVSAGR